MSGRRTGRVPATRHLERLVVELGFGAVAGVDEVGMGPLAGPVVAAAVVLPPRGPIPPLHDSKLLAPRRREDLACRIRACARAVGIGCAEPDEIDRLDILRAAQAAMRRAVGALAPARPDFVIVDGREVPGLGQPQVALPGADGFVASVAAASIVAKVHRDGLMRELAQVHPDYGFDRHVGYGTREHLAALRRHGPCPVHRRSFAPVRDLLGGGPEP